MPSTSARPPRTSRQRQAAGLPLAGLTALQVLDLAGVVSGQRVLVHAAAGGVGHLAVQLAKARGAHVLGTARADKHEFLRDLGVDEPIDYSETAFEDVAKDVDLVIDAIGGDYGMRSLTMIRPGGTLIVIRGGRRPGRELPGAPGRAGARAAGRLHRRGRPDDSDQPAVPAGPGSGRASQR